MSDKAWTPSRVRKLRRKMGVTLDQMAKAVGVTRQAVCYWELGDRPPSKPAQIVMTMLERGDYPFPISPRPSPGRPPRKRAGE